MTTVVLGLLLSTLFNLGPETPVDPHLAVGAAAGEQRQPALAWYGDSLAAAWVEQRYGDSPEVRIAQLDALGHPKGLAARAYGSVIATRLAANGAATPLIALWDGSGTWVGPAGWSGRGITGDLADLVTNGSTYLVLTYDQRMYAEVLDSRGDEIATVSFGAKNRVGRNAQAVPFGGAYHVLYTQDDCFVGCTRAIYDTIVENDGSTSDQLIANGLSTSVKVAAATTGDRLLIAWNTTTSIELLTLRASRTLLTHTSIATTAQQIFSGSDGHEFLVAWNDTHAMQATRIGADGSTQGEPFTFASASVSDVTFARTPQGVVMAWSDGRPSNIFTRGAANFAAIGAAPAVLASTGYVQQDDLSLKGMPVWSEGETHTRVQSLDGTIAEAEAGHALRQPVAALGAGSRLVAWRDIDPGGKSRVMARFDDRAPVLIGESSTLSAVDVAFDGSSFFVVWSNGRLYKTRFTSGGSQLETTEIQSNGKVGGLSAARTGDRVAVAFNDGGTIMYDGENHRAVGTGAPVGERPSIAFDDQEQPFIVWLSMEQGKSCVMTGHRIDSALFAALPLRCDTRTLGSTAVAWNGSEFVVAWSSDFEFGYHNIHYLRVQRNGAALDPALADVSRRFRDTFSPVLVPSTGGVVTLGYVRVAVEEPFDVVARVFTRTLGNLGPPRNRASGH